MPIVRENGIVEYRYQTVRIKLYDDYLTWYDGIVNPRQFTLRYDDIISVSYSNGGFESPWIELNTAGRAYRYVAPVAGRDNVGEFVEEIEKRRAQFKSNVSGVSAQTININPNNVEPTITRIDLFLEDGDWNSVKSYANAALDYFPTDYRLYKFLLLSDLKCHSLNDLKNCGTSFASNSNYKKLERYADDSLKKELRETLEYIEKEPIYKQARVTSDKTKALELFKRIRGYKDSNDYISTLQVSIKEDENRKKEKEEQDKESRYQAAIQLQNQAETLDEYKKALDAYEGLKGILSDGNAKRYYDVVNRYKEVKAKCEELQTKEDYSSANELLASGEISKVKKAEKLFESISDYEDSKEKYCKAKEILAADAEARKQKKKKAIICLAICLVIAIVGGIIVNNNIKAKSYEKAIALYKAERYIEAKEIFDKNEGYKDSGKYAQDCARFIALEEQYQAALSALEEANYDVAKDAFGSMKDYKDCAEMEQLSKDCAAYYNSLKENFNNGDFVKAKENLDQLSNYLDDYIYESLDSAITYYSKWSGTYIITGETNYMTWGDADDYKIHVKVTVKDVEINHDLKEVSLHPYMRMDFKDTIPSSTSLEFDEWDETENCFVNHTFRRGATVDFLTATRNEENGNLEFRYGVSFTAYKKMP